MFLYFPLAYPRRSWKLLHVKKIKAVRCNLLMSLSLPANFSSFNLTNVNMVLKIACFSHLEPTHHPMVDFRTSLFLHPFL